MENILTMDNLSFTYDKKKFVLKDINMNFTPGVLYGILVEVVPEKALFFLYLLD